MKSILLKDYLEQRMYFFIILAVAVVSLIVAAFFKQLDSGVALVMLFIMQGPLFVYMAANHQISSEVNNRTFPFLTSLPISRLRLWFAKLLFVFLYTLALYTCYVILAIICGATPTELLKLFNQSPTLVVGLPMIILAFGYFTTMLPKGFSTISILILVPVIIAIGINSATLSRLNFELGTVFLISMFLALSAIIFTHDKAMNSPWRGVKGIALLIIGTGLLLACWTAIDAAGEHFWSLDDRSEAIWIPLNEGKSLLWRVQSTPRWWDVINNKGNSARLLMHNLETGEIEQVGKRNSSFSRDYPMFNQGMAAIFRGRTVAGFYRGKSYAVIDNNGQLLKDLPCETDDYSYDFKLIDDQRFIYSEEIKNGKTSITEFSLYEKGKGARVVFSAQENFGFADYLVMPAKESGKPASVYVACGSNDEKGKIVLVNADDGKKTVLPIKPHSTPIVTSSDFIVYDEGRWNNKTNAKDHILTLAHLDGKTESLDWLNQNIKIIRVTASGSLIALMPLDTQDDWYSPHWKSLIEINLAERNIKEIIAFPFPCEATVRFTKDSGKALIYLESRNLDPSEHKLLALDLTTMKVAEFTTFNNFKNSKNEIVGSYIQHGPGYVGGNRFMMQLRGEIFTIDVDSMQVERKTDLVAFTSRLMKGGAAND